MPEQPARNTRSRKPLGRASVCLAGAAIALSLFAFAIVVGNVAAGARPETDENAWAHMFQLAMAAQIPLVALFLVTADWGRARHIMTLLFVQLCSAAVALAALSWSGF